MSRFRATACLLLLLTVTPLVTCAKDEDKPRDVIVVEGERRFSLRSATVAIFSISPIKMAKNRHPGVDVMTTIFRDL
jgi:hypothetical protein